MNLGKRHIEVISFCGREVIYSLESYPETGIDNVGMKESILFW